MGRSLSHEPTNPRQSTRLYGQTVFSAGKIGDCLYGKAGLTRAEGIIR